MGRKKMTHALKNLVTLYFKKRLLIVFALGFSSGLPLLLTLSTMAFWFSTVGVDKTTIGLFALVGLPYIWKFLWAPFMDCLPFPFLTKSLGRRRGWLVAVQIFLAGAIGVMGMTNPQTHLYWTALAALSVTFLSATQDILIDAYRVEILDPSEYAAGSAMVVFGYRMGMIMAGGVALSLSDHYTWATVYGVMASCMGVGLLTTFIAPESPVSQKSSMEYSTLTSTFLDPLRSFISRPYWVMTLAFIILYKVGDNLIGQMGTVFYREMGFTGAEIGMVTKTFGIWMVVLGGFVGGMVANRYGIFKTLLLGGISHILANGFFIVLAVKGHSLPCLYGTVIAENITGGIMTSAFVAYLSRLCDKNYTATHYAFLSAVASLDRVFVQTGSGYLAERLGWVEFFILMSVAAIPGLMILLFLMRRQKL